MIKGLTKKQRITIDEILSHTNGGFDIFMLYLGKISRLMNRPWGRKEKKMSWGVYPNNGIFFWKDQATEESGTAIQFVQKMFNLTFQEALDKVAWDFGLGGENVNPKPIIIDWKPPEEEDKHYMEISFIDQPFRKEHHDFWNVADVTEDHCRKYNCFAVKSLAIEKKRVNIRRDEPVFVYVCDEGYKVYFPKREKDKRFRNNVPYRYLWNYNNITYCEDLVVQKSVKDLIVTTLITPCVIATQAEHMKIFNEEVVDKINLISKSPWIFYGSDDDGVRKCTQITNTNGWRYVNTPKNLLPEINDAYSYACKFGIKGLEEFMKLKKVVK